MGRPFDIDQELNRLRLDYANATGEPPFKHFYCPILFEDSEVELCAGHIVNECIPNSSRRCIIQRKDVDGFYGSLVEGDFTTALAASGKAIEDFVADDVLRRKLPLSVNIDGKQVAYYEPRTAASPKHPLVHVEKPDGGFLTLALKVSAESLPESAHLQLIVDRDYTAQAVASLLKAAHLTMFAIMGYKYVFGPTGQDVARILRDFYLQNRDVNGAERRVAVGKYFEKFAGMVMPLGGFDQKVVQGSIEDNRFMVCVGTSGKFFAIGVFVRTNDKMSIVLLSPDEAESVGTYFSFTKERWKNPFHYHLADFISASEDKGAYWKGYRDRLLFDPQLPADVA